MNENVVKNASRYLQEYDKTQADVAKLHNEVNQLRNQELLINSFAITLVAVTMNQANGVLISVLTIILLFLIGLWQHNILITRTHIATYLRIFHLSKWEEDYRKLVKDKKFPCMRKLNYSLFMLLGSIVFFITCNSIKTTLISTEWGGVLIGIFVIYFLVFLHFLCINENSALTECEKEWKNALGIME